MDISGLMRTIDLGLAYPVGIVELPPSYGEVGKHFLLLLKTSQEEHQRLLGIRTVKVLLEFIPTKRFPLLWFRLQIEDGSKGPSGEPIYFHCEFNFNILEEDHARRLRELLEAPRFTLLHGNADLSHCMPAHFAVDADRRHAIDVEIQACRNSLTEYGTLSATDWAEGLRELGESRTITGKIIREDLAFEQSKRRLRFQPFPVGRDVVVQFDHVPTPDLSKG